MLPCGRGTPKKTGTGSGKGFEEYAIDANIVSALNKYIYVFLITSIANPLTHKTAQGHSMHMDGLKNTKPH